MMHSATACSGEVSRRSLNHTACVPVTLFKLYATSAASNPPRSIFDASKFPTRISAEIKNWDITQTGEDPEIPSEWGTLEDALENYPCVETC